MPEKEDLRPISPLGQRYMDMSWTHALLRDPIPFLKKVSSVENALANMHQVQSSDLPDAARASLPKYQENPLTRTFLDTKVSNKEHWKALFQLLKEAGFTDKNELIVATSNHINFFVEGDGKRLSHQKREQIGDAAREALEEVFADSKN